MWIVQPLQKKNPDGSPSGIWHLVANSDEGGGMAPGCQHDHASPEEAAACEDAQRACGRVTGFPWKSPAEQAAEAEAEERAELARLQAKWGAMPPRVTDEMVNRFLCWPLPHTFAPDAGISFKRPVINEFNEHYPPWPIGTNLLTATEARAMLEHVLGVRS